MEDNTNTLKTGVTPEDPNVQEIEQLKHKLLAVNWEQEFASIDGTDYSRYQIHANTVTLEEKDMGYDYEPNVMLTLTLYVDEEVEAAGWDGEPQMTHLKVKMDNANNLEFHFSEKELSEEDKEKITKIVKMQIPNKDISNVNENPEKTKANIDTVRNQTNKASALTAPPVKDGLNEDGTFPGSPKDMRLSFFRTPKDIKKKYWEELEEGTMGRNRGLTHWHNTPEMTADRKQAFAAYLNRTGDTISDQFYEDATNLAEDYAAMSNKDPDNPKPKFLFKSKQLAALLYNPTFVTDARAINVLEALSKGQAMPSLPLWIEKAGRRGNSLSQTTDQLKDGFNLEALPFYQLLLDNPVIWQGSNQSLKQSIVYHFNLALHHLGKQDPENEKIRSAKIKLLDLSVDYPEVGELHIGNGYFFDKNDIEALQEVVQKNPASKRAQKAAHILRFL